MATYRRKDDPMVSCPYNPAHRMLQSRLQMHLTKCKKDHPDADMKTCPFNAKHRVNSTEFSHHLVVCPDKALVERKIAFEKNEHRGNIQVPSYCSSVTPAATDDFWDDQHYDVETSQVEKKVTSTPIFKDIHHIQQMKPAERKKYYRSLCKEDGEEKIEKYEQEPERPAIQKKVLKELRQPRSQPEDLAEWQQPSEAQWTRSNLYNPGRGHIQNSGLGRDYSNRRIAANIFGQAANEPCFYLQNYLTDGMASLNLGRGRGALGAPINEAPVTVDDYPPIPHGQVNKVL